MSKIEVNAIEPQCGTTLTIGASDTSISGIGTVNWQTGSIKTSTFTAVSGQGFFADTSSSAFTMNLPAATAGNIVSVVDYTNTFQTNNLTITPNGSQKIGGVNASAVLETEGQSVTFVYVDDTEGWKNVQDSTSNAVGVTFISASGGTVTTSGDFKIHKFTGPGTFTVSSVGQGSALSNTVDYLVVAGGGSGGADAGAGGGAGGLRASATTYSIGCNPAKPLVCGVSALPVSAQGYPITVGGGGTAPGPGNGAPGGAPHGANGNNSVFSTITSTAGGGGGGGVDNSPPAPGGGNGNDGGSGGGGRGNCSVACGGTGNTPPVSPAQGTNGGDGGGPSSGGSGGGGGAIVAGGAGGPSGPKVGGPGGAGAGFTCGAFGPGVGQCSSCVQYFAGGGAGGGLCAGALSGGLGGGGANGTPVGANGTANTGGGGGGGRGNDVGGGTGGSGIVIIRYKFQ